MLFATMLFAEATAPRPLSEILVIIGAIGAALGGLATPIIAAFILVAKLKAQASAVTNVKNDLAAAVGDAKADADEKSRTLHRVETLVDGRMTQILQELAGLRKGKADHTGDLGDIALAKQAAVDAKASAATHDEVTKMQPKPGNSGTSEPHSL